MCLAWKMILQKWLDLVEGRIIRELKQPRRQWNGLESLAVKLRIDFLFVQCAVHNVFIVLKCMSTQVHSVPEGLQILIGATNHFLASF